MKEYEELFIAKLAATLNILWGITDSNNILEIAKKYIEYKHSIDATLEDYLERKLQLNLPYSWFKAIETHSIFYSYCYGLFKLVPLTFLAAGFPVAILMSDNIKTKQAEYFNKLSKLWLHQNGWCTDFKLLSHKDENLLFKMRTLIEMGYKIIFFIDGNKGIEKSEKNLYKVSFKQSNFLFHQGFGIFNYLYKSDTLHGLSIANNNGNIVCRHWVDSVNSYLPKQEYTGTVIKITISNLDMLIHPDNVHQWDALLSLYKWKKHEKMFQKTNYPISKQFYTSFKIGKNEFYILNHQTFMVYPTDEKTYHKLRIVL